MKLSSLKQNVIDSVVEYSNEYFKKPSFNTYGLVSWFRFGDTLDENGEIYASVDTSNVIYDRFGDDILSSTLTIQTDSHGSKTLLKNKYEAAINFPSASTIVGV